MSASFGNVWIVSDRCPPALPSADLSLRRRQPRRRVELPHVQSLFTNIGWHFRLGDFSASSGCWEFAARGKLCISLFGSNLFWYTLSCSVCYQADRCVSHKGTRWWTRHRDRAVHSHTKQSYTNEQAKQLEKQHEQKTRPFVLLSQARMIKVCCWYCLWWDFNLLNHSSPSDGVVQSWCSRPVLTKYGINFSSHGGDKISSILPSEFKVKRCSL